MNDGLVGTTPVGAEVRFVSIEPDEPATGGKTPRRSRFDFGENLGVAADVGASAGGEDSRDLGDPLIAPVGVGLEGGERVPRFLASGVGRIGYDELENRFRKGEPGSAIDLVWLSSRSYVKFAIEEPELFALMFMFRPDAIEIDVDPEGAAEHRGASSVFDSMLANLTEAIESGDLKKADPLDYGLALWAAVHGVATVASLAPGLQVDPLLDTVVGGLLAGWAA